MKTDAELLREYTLQGSEAAFGEVVRRYADFVYSAALRQVPDPESARDVAQTVFVDLARKAGSLRPNTLLIGWLCRGARLAALEQRRGQHRRLQRERQAMELADASPEPIDDWSAVRPVLDEAIARLGEDDRDALLLRYFKNETLAAVGAVLGVSEDAAQKRVSRALARLREFLAERGIKTTTAALSVALVAHGVQAAPTGFAAAFASGALTKAAAAAGSASLFNLLTANHMKTAILTLLLGGGVAALTVQQVKTQSRLREAQATIQQQAESLQALDRVKEQLAAQNEELEKLRGEAQDVVRLRGEVARLRSQAAAVGKTPAVAQSSHAESGNVSNVPLPSVSLAAKFVLLPTESLRMLNVGWIRNPEGTATGLLSQEQFAAVSQALEGASDAKILCSPRVVTRTGVEARMLAGPNMSGAVAGSGLNGAGGGGGGGFGTVGSSTITAADGAWEPAVAANPGMSLTVLPSFSEGSSIFDLELTAGFGQWVDRSPQPDGSRKEMQATQAKVHVAVSDGQTAILARDLPDAWTDPENAVPGPKSLLVFITPSRFQGAERLAHILHRVTTNQ